MADQTYVGSLRGEFSVDGNGGAGHSIPIAVPPGIGQMSPRLAVAYNSGGGNDLLGMGWALQGLSSITRTAATLAQDGFVGCVDYDSSDRFALDGQRLVPVTGNYGDSDAVYHTEIESWQKVVPVYSQPVTGRSGPDSFIVTSKDGKTLDTARHPTRRYRPRLTIQASASGLSTRSPISTETTCRSATSRTRRTARTIRRASTTPATSTPVSRRSGRSSSRTRIVQTSFRSSLAAMA